MAKHKAKFFIKLLVCVQCCFATANTKTVSYAKDGLTLEYVTAIFRHGERTVDGGTLYPKDPYINETYYPYGIGQLTTKGKEREFTLGEILRKRYDALLGNVFAPDMLEAVSTNMNRTKASLALVLASLYPPKGNIMEWNAKLNWQPIPYNYLDYEQDVWFTISLYFCPNYAKEYASFLSGPEGSKLFQKYGDLYEYLRNNTGMNIKRAIDAFMIYSCLESETLWGLTPPEWAKSVWPDKLAEASRDGLASGVATRKLKQLSGGLTVKRIIENMKAKANGTLELETRKMSLYSGHDLSIVYVLGALNSYIPHIVKFGSCVLVELHKISDDYYVKVVYVNYEGEEPKTLTIPGCEELCPLGRFEELLKGNYPDKENPCGEDVSVFDEDTHFRDYYKGKLHYKTLRRRYVNWARDARHKLNKSVYSARQELFERAKQMSGNLNTLGKKHKDFFGHN